MAEQKTKQPSRRLIVLGALAAGGGAAIGFALMPFSRVGEQRKLLASQGAHVLNGALRIGADDRLTVIIPHADMGVGNGTALAQQLAEELDADWTKVAIERAPGEIAFANGALGQAYLRGDTSIPEALAGASWLVTRRLAESMNLQITGGSTAIRFTGMEGMRHAGACARFMLTHAAAKEWGVPVKEITIENGRLKHASGKESSFGTFAEKSLAFDPPARLPFKAKADYKIVGQSKPRFDLPAKVTGEAKYSADLRLPDMVFAAIRATPVPGGTLKSVDEAPAKAMRGVLQVIKTDNAVAVLADNFWRAKEAVNALDPQWDDGAAATLNSADSVKAMEAAVKADGLKKDYESGDAAKVFAASKDVIERTYTVPYLAHAAVEPVGCVAQFKDGKLTIWGAFQDALGAKMTAAETAELNPDAVTIVHTEMGGAFGRRGGTLDFLDHTIKIAKQTDRAVNLLYTREEDMTHDFYRNASVARMRAVLGAEGKPIAVSHHYADKDDPKEASQFPYALPAVEAMFAKGVNTAPWGPWRSVDHSIQGYFIESFIDELAHEAKADPVAYRRALLTDKPRFLAALNAAAEMANWDQAKTDKTACLGISLVQSFGTIVAQCARVVLENGKPRVTDVWVAADPGLVVNPNGFAQQMESGVIYGLSAALYGQITFEKGRAQQVNFTDYPVVTMADCPRIHVKLLESGAPTGGAGEPATPPIAAAVSNALFALTGQRTRSLPLSNHSWVGAAQPA
jgi:isoquinoline 1-oxidoreductase beta subunit